MLKDFGKNLDELVANKDAIARGRPGAIAK
jgi:hypothetical protein